MSDKLRKFLAEAEKHEIDLRISYTPSAANMMSILRRMIETFLARQKRFLEHGPHNSAVRESIEGAVTEMEAEICEEE